MTKKEPFIINRIKSLGFALKGALLLLKNEASIQVQASIAILVTFAGFYFDISATEWMIQLIAIAIVMSAEALNSAIEYAKENNLKFDFGGSNIEGVKRFNYNLGGIDEVYFMHIQNNGPAWFKLAKRLKTHLIDR